MALTDALTEIEYPESDGQPMAETGIHVDTLVRLRSVLDNFFLDQPDVHVAGNNFLYYVDGDPSSVVSPDMYVVRGLANAKQPRRTYRVWLEGKAPDWVIEVSSRKTRLEGTGRQRDLYQQLGVREYVLFDPLGEYLRPQLRAYVLVDGVYEQQVLDRGVFHSQVLGLDLWAAGILVRAREQVTGRELLLTTEEHVALRVAEAALSEVEAENSRLRAELARLHGLVPPSEP